LNADQAMDNYCALDISCPCVCLAHGGVDRDPCQPECGAKRLHRWDQLCDSPL
jgi:hypothetical protein